MAVNRISNISFGAKIERETIRHLYSPKIIEKPTLEQVMNDYDEAINNITWQKKSAQELDEYMHSDEVKAIVDKLPPNDTITIHSKFKGSYAKNGFHLSYSTKSASVIKRILKHSKKNEHYSDFPAQTRDGSINKEGILHWLNTIADMVK